MAALRGTYDDYCYETKSRFFHRGRLHFGVVWPAGDLAQRMVVPAIFRIAQRRSTLARFPFNKLCAQQDERRIEY